MNCPNCGHAIIEEAAFCPWCDQPVPGAPGYDDYVYEAFISYRHLPHDHEVAVRLQRAIEGFRIPKALRTDPDRKRLGKLFRDEDELPIASSLPDQIGEALKRSRTLIVICSRQTRASQWVQREVELYASYHGRSRIRIALVEGEPDESFPPLLMTKTVVADDGTSTLVEEEPLAADFRDLSRKHFDTERLRLVASIIGCGYDDLRQRMRARRQRVALAVASAVSALSVSFGSFALWQRAQIRQNYRLAQINESELLAEEANELIDQGDRYQAVAVSLSALPQTADATDRPYVPAAQMALERALNIYPNRVDNFYWTTDFSLGGLERAGAAYGSDGSIAACDAEGAIHVFDRDGYETGAIAAQAAPRVAGEGTAYTHTPLLHFADKGLLCVGVETVALYDLETLEQVWSLDLRGCTPSSAFAASADDSLFTLTVQGEKGDARRTVVMRTEDGSVVDEFSYDGHSRPADVLSLENPCAAFSDDGSRLAVGVDGYVYAIDRSTGDVRQTKLAQDEAVALQFLGDDLLALSEQTLGADTSALVQQATVQRLGPSLDEIWSHTTQESVSVSADGSYLASRAGFYGSFPGGEGDGDQEFVLLRSAIVALDAQTGTETYRYEPKEPILDCMGIGDSYYLATTAGNVVFHRVDESTSTWNSFNANLGEATAAHFHVYQGGISLVLWNADPSRCRVYDYGGMGILASERYALETYETTTETTPVWSQNALLTTEGICLLDQETLETTRVVPLDEIAPLSDADHLGMYRAGNGSLYAYSPVRQAGKTSSLVYALSPEGAEQDGSFTLDGMALDPSDPTALKEYEATDGTTVLLAHDQQSVCLLDPSTGERLCQIACDEPVNDCWYAQGKIVVSHGYAKIDHAAAQLLLGRMDYLSSTTAGVRLKTYRASDGSELESLWDGAQPWDGLRSCTSIDSTGTRLAIACTDGSVRLYDVEHDNLVWESAKVENGFQCVYVDGTTGNVLMQDRAGYLILLSGADGTPLKTSSLTVEGINSVSATQDGSLVQATYRRQDVFESNGLIVISLDPDSFGPVSEIPLGLFRNASGTRVALRNEFHNRSVLVCPCLSLEQLIGIANATVEYHPINDYESLIYRLGG